MDIFQIAKMSKTYKCSYMGWTYGVMGETQITASRARGGGGEVWGLHLQTVENVTTQYTNHNHSSVIILFVNVNVIMIMKCSYI